MAAQDSAHRINYGHLLQAEGWLDTHTDITTNKHAHRHYDKQTNTEKCKTNTEYSL